MPHIIIEGIDKSGKSTLARFLATELDMPIKKFSAPDLEVDPFKEYADFLATERTPHIVDRFYLSELAYGPVKRDGSKIGTVQKWLLEAGIKQLNCMPVYCMRDSDEVAASFVKDGEEYLVPEDIFPITQHYRQELAASMLKWNLYTIGADMTLVADRYRMFYKK